MGSGVQPVKETIDYLNKKGEKVGLIQIRLYRPFPKADFIKALPKSVKSIAVLDRTKEPGTTGEPVYQDVMTTLYEFGIVKTVINGRYGLSSKEFTPSMAKAIYDELAKEKPKNHFTIGIHDDVSNTSLEFDADFVTESDDVVRAIFYGLGADGTVGANKNSIKIIGENTDNYCQGYFVYDSKKSGSRTVSHLRFGPKPINSPYLVQSANFVGVHQFNFVEKTNVLKTIAKSGTFLLNSQYSADDVWHYLPRNVQQIIIERKIKLYVIDAYKVAKETGMGSRTNTIMQTCFFALANVIPKELALSKIKEAIKKTYSSKGEEIVKKNYAAVDGALAHLFEVKVPANIDKDAKDMPKAVSDKAPAFVKDVLAKMMTDEGDDLPVSAMPIDGTYPCGTTKWEKRNVSQDIAHWDEKNCIQCGRCSLVCPHGVIRTKRYDEALLKNAPEHFQSADVKGKPGLKHTLQVYLEDCTGCNLCHETCPVKNKENAALKAINLVDKDPILESEKKNIEFFETLPWVDRASMEPNSIPNVQLLEPYFEFSGACAGCGETPYVKLVSQLFGDRMMVANATGCSSIYGGNLPTTPWTCDASGHGPAWANSLFEDNAEFGYGFRVSEDTLREEAKMLLQKMATPIGETLVSEIIGHMGDNTDALIQAQRGRVAALKEKLGQINSNESSYLLSLADHFVHRSIWIFGGDGWAYDIGYGGLDHVLAQGRNVNVMVMDTEVYSNTGGQASKATPLGAVAKFAAGGKHSGKKDLGMMAVNYGNVYVAQIALGSNPAQTLKAIREAESYPGASLVIAYSHCIAHGYNLERGLSQQDLAVKAGHWPLYRYNPMLIAEGKNPFQLDSKAPSIPLKDYIYNEARFKSLLTANPEEAEKLLQEAQEFVNRKWKKYEDLAK
jgi:pyruvate-ferredoxin/flavodoxin oxidoreductase